VQRSFRAAAIVHAVSSVAYLIRFLHAVLRSNENCRKILERISRELGDERVRERASVVATRQMHANDRYLMRQYAGVESRLLGRVRYASSVMCWNETGEFVHRTNVNPRRMRMERAGLDGGFLEKRFSS